jgi:hypothetical protein
LEGKGRGGELAEAARNVATGRDDGPLNNGVGDRGLLDRNRDRRQGGIVGGGQHPGGMLGNTEEEMARLRIKTHITAEGDAYCPNPNLRDLVINLQNPKTVQISFDLCKHVFEHFL